MSGSSPDHTSPDSLPHPACVSGLEVIPLRAISARLVAYDWPWARRHAAAIARDWQTRLAERPRMFDGRVLLACQCTVEDETCRVELFPVRFSQFVAYRAVGFTDGTGVANAFSAIVPHTADGAVLLGRMGAHTVNAGQVYFPCGTPDMDDVRADGRVDLPGSAAREFAEETGLDLPADASDRPWTLIRGAGQLAFLRPVAFAQTAAALTARIAAHHAAEVEPELAGMLAARTPADIDPRRMPGFVRAYLARALAG